MQRPFRGHKSGLTKYFLSGSAGEEAKDQFRNFILTKKQTPLLAEIIKEYKAGERREIKNFETRIENKHYIRGYLSTFGLLEKILIDLKIHKEKNRYNQAKIKL